MSITEAGILAEKKARKWLLKNNFRNHQQLDWIVKHNNKYFIIEVKHRELFSPPPFFGTGLDIRQLELRKQLYDDMKIDTLLFVFETKTNNIYYQFLSKLEQTEYFDTRKRIRIYNIKYFKKDIFEEVGYQMVST